MPDDVTRVLAVANQKGGVAKTTTVASLGAAMVEKGERVLLVDLDPQGCLTFSLGQDPDKLAVSIHEVLLGDVEPDAALVDTSEGMTLLPANIDLAGAEAMLLMRAGREYALKRALAKVADDFDVVIIDCPPSLGVLTLNGLTAADDVIVPLQCETLAHRGVGQFLRTINDVQQITNADLDTARRAAHALRLAHHTQPRRAARRRRPLRHFRCWRRRSRAPGCIRSRARRVADIEQSKLPLEAPLRPLSCAIPCPPNKWLILTRSWLRPVRRGILRWADQATPAG